MSEELATTEPGYDVSKLEGVEKAAILLLSLSEEDAAQILKHLEPKQVQKVGMAMAALDDLSQAKISAVHNLFIEQIQSFSTIGFQSEDFITEQIVREFFLKKSGADVLRLWVATTDYSDDMKIGDEVLSNLNDNYRRIRNTFRFIFIYSCLIKT